MKYEFFIPGTPKTAGSKRHIGGGRIIDDCEKGADWRGDCKVFARQAYNADPIKGAVVLGLSFVRQRPTNHFRTNGQLKPWAVDAKPTTKPDLLKLARALEDALTGIVWADDALIVSYSKFEKVYGDKPGAMVTVEEIKEIGDGV